MSGGLDLFEKNIGFLRSHASNLSLDNILSARAEDACLKVEDSGKAFPTYKIAKDGRDSLLHSERDPRGEAERQIESWAEENNAARRGTFVVAGFGGMHHVEALLGRIDSGHLLIVEPSPSNLKKALSFCDLEKLRKPGVTVVLISSSSMDGIVKELAFFMRRSGALRYYFFFHPGSKRIFTAEYEKLAAEMAGLLRVEMLDKETRGFLGALWHQNAVLNLTSTLGSPSLEGLRDAFRGATAIIVAAGPSLDDSAAHIRAAREKCLVICVGNAMRKLLSEGITPDFVVTIDASSLVIRQFEGLSLDERTWGLSCTHSPPEVMSFLNRKMFVFSTGSLPFFDGWLAGFGARLPCLASGGTVALTAIDAAIFMGVRNIILCGLDLCYRDDGTTHASNCASKQEQGKKTLEAEGNFGKKVTTSEQMSRYAEIIRMYMEDICVIPGMKVLNATTGGAFLGRPEVVAPGEIEGRIVGDASGKTEKIAGIFKESMRVDREKAMERMKTTLRELDELSGLAGQAEVLCGEGAPPEAGLDQLDARLRLNQDGMSFVNDLMTPLLTGLAEMDGEPMEKSRKFYEGLNGVAERSRNLLDISLKAYENNFQPTIII